MKKHPTEMQDQRSKKAMKLIAEHGLEKEVADFDGGVPPDDMSKSHTDKSILQENNDMLAAPTLNSTKPCNFNCIVQRSGRLYNIKKIG